MKIQDLYWAAGFIEGEGSFYTFPTGTPRISVSQKQKEPLERLVTLFGGKIYTYPSRPISYWILMGKNAVGVMMTLYALMSPKRKSEIKKSLAIWKSKPARLRHA